MFQGETLHLNLHREFFAAIAAKTKAAKENEVRTLTSHCT